MASFFNNPNVPSLLSFREEYQPTYLDAPPMDRGRGSRSSVSSGYSNGSYPGQGYGSSPSSSYCPSYGSPSYDYMTPRGSSPYRYSIPSDQIEQPSPREDTVQGNVQSDQDLPPFDPNQGDPRIAWQMYYDFMVTKDQAYWKLKRGYLASKTYPEHVRSEPIVVKVSDSRKKEKTEKTEKRHPCLIPSCKANPFTRHYDLERHFNSLHGGSPNALNSSKVEKFRCDYPKCQHEDPLRKDHCREHYREFHMEDLVKRGGKADNTETETWWERRNILKSWWRCCKCLQKTRTSEGWRCKSCGQQCEQDRQMMRKRLLAESMEDDQNVGFSTAFSDPAGTYVSQCVACEDGWIYDDKTRHWQKCQVCKL